MTGLIWPMTGRRWPVMGKSLCGCLRNVSRKGDPCNDLSRSETLRLVEVPPKAYCVARALSKRKKLLHLADKLVFMNRSPLLCLLIIPAVLLGVANSCKKKGANSVNPSYEGLGIITVQYLTGFALNGDPLCRGTDESVLRWSADKKEWSRVGTLPKINSGYYFEAKCEDALGNFYGVVFDSGCYILPQGATTWAKLNLHSVDSNMSATSETKVSLLSNNNGDIAMLSENRLNTHVRILRKMAASNTWQPMT